MKKLTLILSALLLCTTLSAQLNFIGSWTGTLNGARDLKVGFNITNDGELKATLDVPVQGVQDMPCSGIRISNDSIFISMKAIKGEFIGTLVDVNKIDGLWSQNAITVELDMERTEGKLQLNRPQTPKPPYTYNSENVGFFSSNKGMKFGGTITSPKDDDKHPAIILISGSGAQNRDEELFQHKPFAVVADYLTKRGYVVLRVDDRGVGNTGGDRTNATTADYADDVREVVEYLKTRKEVDKKKIGLYGHSEGAAIAQIVAAGNKDIDFIILMAGPGVSGVELMTEQSVATVVSMGLKEEAAKQYGVLYKGIVSNIIKSKSRDEAGDNVYKILDNWIENTDESTVLMTTGIEDSTSKSIFARQFIDAVWNKWMMYFLQYDPQPYLEKMNCKVLALNGDKDIQVISRTNLEGMVKALDKSKVKTKSIREIEGVNHLFQECTLCTVQEYGQLEQTIKPEVLDIVGDWLDANVK